MSGYEAVVVREGAAVRTADELLLVFVEDAVSLGAELSATGRITLAEFRTVMTGYTNLLSGSASLPESAEGLRMDVESLVNQLETELGTLGFDVEWNDGYVITPSQDEDAAVLERVAEIAGRTAYSLAWDAGCASPDTLESPGAQLLMSVRGALLESLAYAREHDADGESWADTLERMSAGGALDEIADGGPSVYTFTLWTQFVDLAAWQEDISDRSDSSADMESLARLALYSICERLVSVLVSEISDGA